MSIDVEYSHRIAKQWGAFDKPVIARHLGNALDEIERLRADNRKLLMMLTGSGQVTDEQPAAVPAKYRTDDPVAAASEPLTDEQSAPEKDTLGEDGDRSGSKRGTAARY